MMGETEDLCKKLFGKMNEDQVLVVALSSVWELKRRRDARRKKSDNESNPEVDDNP